MANQDTNAKPSGNLKARAIVSRGALSDDKWALEDIAVRAIKDDELLIEMVATGICHTDIVFGSLPEEHPASIYPRVLGHEGSGYVQAIGRNVTVAQPGDPVLLSFHSCGTCPLCQTSHPAYCPSFEKLNLYARDDAFSPAATPDASTSAEAASSTTTKTTTTPISGAFFGQSSFASMTIAAERSVVNVKGLVHGRDELALFAPLGCGVQTGSGTILNVADAREQDSVVVLGLGGVGLSGILAAKLRGCKTIIGVDRIEGRLQLARDLGATHVFNTAELAQLEDLVLKVRDVTDGIGASVVMEASGAMPLVHCSVELARPMGRIMQVGVVPFGSKSEFDITRFMAAGKQFIGAIEGDAKPVEYVPKMIQWYREGKFPIDRFVKVMKAEEWKKALGEMHDGTTVKPVLVW